MGQVNIKGSSLFTLKVRGGASGGSGGGATKIFS